MHPIFPTLALNARLKKTGNKFCYSGYKISANYPLFLSIKLDRNEKYQFLCPTVELSKIKYV